jgi:hypothetical protein
MNFDNFIGFYIYAYKHSKKSCLSYLQIDCKIFFQIQVYSIIWIIYIKYKVNNIII